MNLVQLRVATVLLVGVSLPTWGTETQTVSSRLSALSAIGHRCVFQVISTLTAFRPLTEIAPYENTRLTLPEHAGGSVEKLFQAGALLHQYDPALQELGIVVRGPGWGLCSPTSGVNALHGLMPESFADADSAGASALSHSTRSVRPGRDARRGENLQAEGRLLARLAKMRFPKYELGIVHQNRHPLLPIRERNLALRENELKLLAIQVEETHSHSVLLARVNPENRQVLIHDPDREVLEWLPYRPYADDEGSTLAVYYGSNDDRHWRPISQILHLIAGKK